MSDTGTIVAFLMGLAGSLHCAGMCGPLLLLIPFHKQDSLTKWAGIMLYHLGRISSYALLGLGLYSFRSLFYPQLQQYISIGLGLTLVLLASLSLMPASRLHLKLPWTNTVKRLLGKFLSNPRLGGLFVTGALNGLLPCGLVYMALALAVTTENAVSSIVLMYVFGVGTIPMFLVLHLLRDRTRLITHRVFFRILPVMLFFFGGVLVIRGMNLGLPYLSPSVTIDQKTIKAACCHKR